MKIDNEFTVSVPIDQAWAVLTDLEGIAPCLPGAQLTGADGDVYSGKVKVKVGPVVSEYAGTVRFVEKDDASHRAVIDAKGRDSRGAGNASAAITAQLRADGARTVVTVDTDLKISGKIAQFGSGMIKEVSQKLLGQFVDCLEAKLTADAPEPSPAASPVVAPPGPVQTGPTHTSPAQPGPAQTGPVQPDVPETGRAETSRAQTGAVQASPVEAVQAREPDGAGTGRRVITPEAEAEPLDVMSLAGGSVYKRLLPVVAVVIVIAAVVVYLVVS